MSTGEGQRSISSVSSVIPQSHPSCFLKHGLPMASSSLMCLDCLPFSPRDPATSASPGLWLQAWAVTLLVCMSLGINLRPSGLHKWFTDWAVSVDHFNVLSTTLMKTQKVSGTHQAGHAHVAARVLYGEKFWHYNIGRKKTNKHLSSQFDFSCMRWGLFDGITCKAIGDDKVSGVQKRYTLY